MLYPRITLGVKLKCNILIVKCDSKQAGLRDSKRRLAYASGSNWLSKGVYWYVLVK